MTDYSGDFPHGSFDAETGTGSEVFILLSYDICITMYLFTIYMFFAEFYYFRKYRAYTASPKNCPKFQLFNLYKNIEVNCEIWYNKFIIKYGEGYFYEIY